MFIHFYNLFSNLHNYNLTVATGQQISIKMLVYQTCILFLYIWSFMFQCNLINYPFFMTFNCIKTLKIAG